MKIAYMSDLHIDSGFGIDTKLIEMLIQQRSNYHVLVIAGDVSNHAQTTFVFLKKLSVLDVDIVFVSGNHEFYNINMVKGTEILNSLNDEKKYHVLNENNIYADIEFEGGVTRFVGDVLWTDFNLNGTPVYSKNVASEVISDFRFINLKAGTLLIPSDTVKIHNKTLARLSDIVTIKSGCKIVLVSHHAPSIKSIDERYKGNIFNAAFSSGLLDLHSESYIPWSCNIDLWIHGHVHSSFDYEVLHSYYSRTRVVCNPRGYEYEEITNEIRFSLKIIDV